MTAPAINDELIREAANLLQLSHFAVVLTGAGISVPSGIPDFRSARTGLWEQDDPMKVASLTAFRKRPEVFFNWLRPLAVTAKNALPNPAHLALARLQKAGKIKSILTQNIDGLHTAAGATHVTELHGTMLTATCPSCREPYPMSRFEQVFLEQAGIPHCPRCGAVVKPDIVLYEEQLPQEAWLEAETACALADLILVIGTSLEVFPVASLPQIALQNKARLIINCLSETHLDSMASILLPYDVVDVIPRISEYVL